MVFRERSELAPQTLLRIEGRPTDLVSVHYTPLMTLRPSSTSRQPRDVEISCRRESGQRGAERRSRQIHELCGFYGMPSRLDLGTSNSRRRTGGFNQALYRTEPKPPYWPPCESPSPKCYNNVVISADYHDSCCHTWWYPTRQRPPQVA